MKVLRAVAGVHFGKFSFHSLDLIFDFSEVGSRPHPSHLGCFLGPSEYWRETLGLWGDPSTGTHVSNRLRIDGSA